MRTPYKMKGSTFYGKGNSSPAKVTDSEVVQAINKLGHTQMDFREPGWTKLAKGLNSAVTKPIKEAIGKADDKKGVKTKHDIIEGENSKRPSFEQLMEDEKAVKERAHNRNYQKGYDEELGY